MYLSTLWVLNLCIPQSVINLKVYLPTFLSSCRWFCSNSLWFSTLLPPHCNQQEANGTGHERKCNITTNRGHQRRSKQHTSVLLLFFFSSFVWVAFVLTKYLCMIFQWLLIFLLPLTLTSPWTRFCSVVTQPL